MLDRLQDRLRFPRALDSSALLVPAVAVASLLVAIVAQPSLPVEAAAAGLLRAARIGSSLAVDPALSDPLGTLLLFFGGLFGLDVLAGSSWLAALAFSAAVAAIAALARSCCDNADAGWAAGALALLWAPFREAMLASSGIGLAVALSCLGLWVAVRSRPIFAGVLFGLAMTQNPGALAALAGPVAAAWILTRTLPLQIVKSAGLTVLASSTVRLLATGSVSLLPASAGGSFDSDLVVAELVERPDLVCGALLMVAAMVALRATPRRDEPEAVVTLACGAGLAVDLLLHLVADGNQLTLSHVSLMPPVLVLAASAPWSLRRSGWRRAATLRTVVLALLAIGALVELAALAALGSSIVAPSRREAFDLDRLSAGRWLALHADRSESLDSESAWVRFGADGLLPAAHSLGAEADYIVAWGVRTQGEIVPPTAPAGYLPLALFDAGFRRFGDLPWVTVFGRLESAAERTGVRAFTLLDLAPPGAVPEIRPPKAVGWHGASLLTHPPGGVRFQVANGRRPFQIRFAPAFTSGVDRELTDGVTFELRTGSSTLWRHHQYGTDPERELTLRVADGLAYEEMTVDLLVGAGPMQNAIYDSALWRDLRIFVEGALVKPRLELPADPEEPGEGEDDIPTDRVIDPKQEQFER